jgi:hypothetical protein
MHVFSSLSIIRFAILRLRVYLCLWILLTGRLCSEETLFDFSLTTYSEEFETKFTTINNDIYNATDRGYRGDIYKES